MYVNHEFMIAVITLIFAFCRDFRQLPWFCVTAMIITKICTISTLSGQFWVNICSAFLFLGAYSRMINPTSLSGMHIQNDGIMLQSCSARLHSSFLDQTVWDTAHVTTSIQL